MKIECTLSFPKESLKSYESKLGKFELQIMKISHRKNKLWYFFADTLLYPSRIDLYDHLSLVL